MPTDPTTAAFATLVEPNRRAILDVLIDDGSQTVGQLVERLQLSQSLVSKHLHRLLAADLVEVRSEGRQRRYRARPEGLYEVAAWIERHRQHWSDRRAQPVRHALDPGGSANPTPAVTRR